LRRKSATSESKFDMKRLKLERSQPARARRSGRRPRAPTRVAPQAVGHYPAKVPREKGGLAFVPSSLPSSAPPGLVEQPGIEAYEMEFAARRRFGRLAHRAHRWPRGGRDFVIECDASEDTAPPRNTCSWFARTASEVHGIQKQSSNTTTPEGFSSRSI
jgi:hypothetical protein